MRAPRGALSVLVPSSTSHFSPAWVADTALGVTIPSSVLPSLSSPAYSERPPCRSTCSAQPLAIRWALCEVALLVHLLCSAAGHSLGPLQGRPAGPPAWLSSAVFLISLDDIRMSPLDHDDDTGGPAPTNWVVFSDLRITNPFKHRGEACMMLSAPLPFIPSSF